jgi:alkanesulfonate monooxygenase SsuD/methylene tetrahydromethanopterin reductase-like flavin-dependent oxidoreductase (luciferase family)
VELDLLYEIDVPKPWPDGQRAAEAQAFGHCLEEVRFADTLGFRTVWFVEHHFREERSHCSAPEVVIGALSQVTKNVRLGFGVVLTPPGFQHPVRVAEKVATADILCGGRLEWGTGRSTPVEQTGFGVPTGEESREQWREGVEACVQAWASEQFSFEGKFVKFPAAKANNPTRAIVPKPYQEPHPPAWCAAVTESSARAAGAAGMGLLSFSIMRPLHDMATQVAAYREGAADATPLTNVTTNKVAAYTLVHCTDTLQQAETNGIWDAVWWWYQNYAETALKWDFPELDKEQQDKMFPLLKKQAAGEFDVREFNDADMIIVGDVDTVIEKMVRYAELGIDHLICYSSFGGLPHQAVMHNLELLGTKVIPELKKHGIDARATLTPEALRAKASEMAKRGDARLKGPSPDFANFTPGGISS